MDILILIINIIILLLLIPNLPLLVQIMSEVSKLTIEKPSVQEKAKVTDPFQKPAPIHSSTNHIIVPKTPTEIRNQNYKKIKEGIGYGDIAQR